jgi:Ribbon-helix-helix protein, copG family
MAVTSVRSSYALKPETVARLEALARRWNVSKSEALRRAIEIASGKLSPELSPLAALEDLQKNAALQPEEAESWNARIRKNRKAARWNRFGAQ